jgi:hypothetical protein
MSHFTVLDQELLEVYQHRWRKAGETLDVHTSRLTKSEFFIFRHPEYNSKSILELAQSIMDGLGTLVKDWLSNPVPKIIKLNQETSFKS